MDFQLTEDQQALRNGMRELLAKRFPRERLRDAVRGEGAQEPGTAPPGALDRGLWRELGAAGFFALRLAEADGGVGLGLPEAVLAFEETGRALLPGPLVATHLAAGAVPGAAKGATVVTGLDLGRGQPCGPVEHLASAGTVLVLDAAAVRALPAAALTAEPIRSVDPATPLARAAAPAGGRVLPDAVADVRRTAALLTAAQQLGSAARTVEMAVEHARRREQFGAPIGSFQAVKHLCAEMLVRSEIARSAVYAASVVDDATAVAGAKLLADDAAVRNARDCLQVHGGMGFTWEADVHLHLKRAWLRAEQWQRAAEAEEALAAALAAGP